MEHKKTAYPRLFPLYLVLYELACYLSNDAYLPALSHISHDLGVSNSFSQLSLTAFFFGNALAQLIMGPIADRLGRVPVMRWGGIVFVATTLLLSITYSPWLLLTARFFEGAALAPLVITGYSTIHALLSQRDAIKTLAWMSGITVLAPAFGPLLGALILLHFSWRYIFLILGVWAAVCLRQILKTMPETLSEKQPLALRKIAFDYYRLITTANFIRPTLCLCFIFSIMLAWITDGPFLIIEQMNKSPLYFAGIQAIIFSCLILGTKCVAKLMEHYSIRTILIIVMSLLWLAILAVLALTHLKPDQLIDVVLPLCLVGFGSGIGFPIFNRLAVEVPVCSLSVRMALFSSFICISGFIGSLLVTLMHNDTPERFAHLIALLALLASLIYCPTLFYREKPK